MEEQKSNFDAPPSWAPQFISNIPHPPGSAPVMNIAGRMVVSPRVKSEKSYGEYAIIILFGLVSFIIIITTVSGYLTVIKGRTVLGFSVSDKVRANIMDIFKGK